MTKSKMEVVDRGETTSIGLVGPLAEPSGLATVLSAVTRGRLAARGPFWNEASAVVSSVCETPCISLTSSGTAALEIGAMALALQPEDEVIVPTFTFVTTASAFARVGASLKFADIDPATLTMDPSSVADLIGSRTAAIVAMHYGGVACDLDSLSDLATRAGSILIEDNAHGFGGRYRGRALGSFGQLSILSFDWMKNITCGEGGAILATDETLAGRIEMIVDRGTNRRAFERGECERYEWMVVGTNADLSELVAGYLLDQLRRREDVQERRRRVWASHDAALGAWASTNGATLPHVPETCEPSHHIYFILVPDPATRPRFIDHLAKSGIESAFHYAPLHTSPFGQLCGGRLGECPVAESVAERIVRIPCHHGLGSAELDRIHDAVTTFNA